MILFFHYIDILDPTQVSRAGLKTYFSQHGLFTISQNRILTESLLHVFDQPPVSWQFFDRFD